MKIAGLILAGGRSSRYGKQKLFESYRGQPLYKSSVHALQAAGIKDVFIVTNDRLKGEFEAEGYSVILDDHRYAGPLHALYNGMNASACKHVDWFQVLAGDLPHVHDALLRELQTAASTNGHADIILPQHNEKAQPLHALYHRRCLPILDEIAPKERSMRALYERVSTEFVEFPHHERGFLNINSEQDWQERLHDE